MRGEEAIWELWDVWWPEKLGAGPSRVSGTRGSAGFILEATGIIRGLLRGIKVSRAASQADPGQLREHRLLEDWVKEEPEGPTRAPPPAWDAPGDPAGQGMGREAGRGMRGGASRWETLGDLRWRSQRHTRGSSAQEGQGSRPEESPGYTCCQNRGSPEGTQEGCRVRVETRRPAWAMLRG